MESKKERVLAYSMAKLIEQDELAEIAGGWGGHQSSHGTGKATGGSGQGVDFRIDYTWDIDI